MRIAYFFDTHDIYRHSGILQKAKQQTECWRALGHQVHLIILCAQVDKNRKPILDCLPINSIAIKDENSPVLNYLNKVGSISALKKLLRSIQPDLLYVRQNIWYPGLDRIYRQYNTVMELNTLDLQEVKHDHILRRILYRYGRPKLLNSIKGVIPVSNEIAEKYKDLKSETIPNGIILDKNIGPKSCTGEVNLIFAGTPDLPWHGVDKFIRMAALFPDFIFHLVGPKSDAKLSNLIQHGYLQEAELHALYGIVDIGVGTLALHRNGMNEASPLKVREYLSHGLPTIIAYIDSDLNPDLEGILQLPNTPNNVDLEKSKIETFVNLWKGKRISLHEIHPLIDRKKKEAARINFFDEIISSN